MTQYEFNNIKDLINYVNSIDSKFKKYAITYLKNKSQSKNNSQLFCDYKTFKTIYAIAF